MTNTSIILANPDLLSIRESLKLYLKGQVEFKDYDFDGSNLSTLLNILSASTYQNAFMKNMIASELFLSTAQLSNSIFSRARELGYQPRSAKSASALLKIEIFPHDSPSTITIPKETIFSATVGSRNLNFLTDSAYVFSRDINGRYVGEVVVYEGLFVQDIYVTNSNTKYIINNKFVDMNSLEVTVTSDTTPQTFIKQDNIIDLKSSTDLVFYTQMNYQGFYEIYFGDNIIGKQPEIGSNVFIRYRVSSAEAGNNAGSFKPSTTISGYSNIQILESSLSSGGAPVENAEITRKYAPLANQIRDRAFTDDDYKILLKNEFPEIMSINVFGGETLDPPQYGKVAISITTDESIRGISNNLKQKYTTFINSKNPNMITPVFIEPEVLQIKLTTKVYYDYTLTHLTENDITLRVEEQLKAFNRQYLNNYDIILRKSKLGSAIDNSDTSINSNETKLELTTILDHVAIMQRAKTINTYNAIRNVITNAQTPNVYSTNFKFDGKTCRLSDDSDGFMYVVTLQNNSFQKLKRVGSVDYKNGVINLTPIAIQALMTTNLKLIITPENEDIVADKNVILQLDFSEHKIETIAQKR